ncbi:MAG TPA: sensor domain-containing diguanylate cyclase [Gemmatimonadaceae bacterium]|nr:sensor domain-containing diguanylate cyclase [Gemmatimonadaceae bacterium]
MTISTPASLLESADDDAASRARVSPGLTRADHHARLTSASRLAALQASGLLDGATTEVLDRLARLVTRLLGVPIALVSLVDDRGQHFPGMAGLGGWAGDARGTPLSHSFCQHVVATDRMLLVEDASQHPLVRDNLAFTELGVVAYAGVPLRTADGETLGALCAIDTAPARWVPEQVATLEDLSAAAMAEIELRATMRSLLVAQAELQASQYELQAAHDRLKAQSVRDQLTGLLNRRGFSDAARQQLAVAERTKAAFLVAALDLDGFKQINDTFGHDVGDEALTEMAVVLTETFRTSDIIARFGGDEFVVLLTNNDVAEADAVRARLLDALAAHNAEPGREFTLATSIGIAAWTPEVPKSLPVLLKEADDAMYAEKRMRKTIARAAA